MAKLSFEELKNSEYDFQWVKTDRAGMVTAISVERRALSEKFENVLIQHGYIKKGGRKKHYTDHFVYQGG